MISFFEMKNYRKMNEGYRIIANISCNEVAIVLADKKETSFFQKLKLKIKEKIMNDNSKEMVYEHIKLFDTDVLFTPSRIDRAKLPKGVYCYEVQHDDDMNGEMTMLGRYIMINHWGTILSSKKISLDDDCYREIEEDKDVQFLDDKSLTLKEYLKKFPLKNKQKCR